MTRGVRQRRGASRFRLSGLSRALGQGFCLRLRGSTRSSMLRAGPCSLLRIRKFETSHDAVDRTEFETTIFQREPGAQSRKCSRGLTRKSGPQHSRSAGSSQSVSTTNPKRRMTGLGPKSANYGCGAARVITTIYSASASKSH